MKEEQTEQKEVILLSGLMFLAAFIVAGLNFRFKWIILPDWVSYAAAAVFMIAYALYAEVLRENAYLSRTVEVQKNQKVIDTLSTPLTLTQRNSLYYLYQNLKGR